MFILKGNPVPLARARFSQYKVYDSQKHLRVSKCIELEQQVEQQLLRDQPIQLQATFFMPIPKSYSKKRYKTVLGQPHIFKPDISNLIKWIEDLATGIIYHDDCVITQIIANKVYDPKPRTEFSFTIYEADRNED